MQHAAGVLLHELWHAFLYLKGTLWHKQGEVDGKRGCQAVYMLCTAVRKKLGYPDINLSFVDSDVRKALG